MDPVVAVALRHIEHRANVGSKLANPDARAAARAAFQILAQHRYPLDAAEVERWAVDRGSTKEAAAALRSFVVEVRVRHRSERASGAPFWPPEVIDIGRAEAESSAP